MAKIIDPLIAEILSVMRCEEDLAHPCDRQLDRPIYITLNKVLNALGGKWNRKRKGHVFASGNAAESIADAIATGQYVDHKQEFQQFFTPPRFADELVEMAGVKSGMTCLEPSAGNGSIAKALRASGALVDCIELHKPLADDLAVAGLNVVHADFLEVDIENPPGYGAIVMNPPFTRSQDIRHVQRAWRWLSPNGILVAVMSPGWTFRSDHKAEEFRLWVDDLGGHYTKNPPGTFKVSGTNVDTLTLIIEKQSLGEPTI